MWQCYVHKLRAWVAGDDGVPVRPYLMLVISTEVGVGRGGHTYPVPITLNSRGCSSFQNSLRESVEQTNGRARSPKDGALLTCEPGDTDGEGVGDNVVKSAPSAETVMAFLQRVMTYPRVMNTSKAGEKRTPSRPSAIRFADTATAAMHLGDPDKWAHETACPYVRSCAAGLAVLGVHDCTFAPVPQQLVREIIRGQIEPNMARGLGFRV